MNFPKLIIYPITQSRSEVSHVYNSGNNANQKEKLLSYSKFNSNTLHVFVIIEKDFLTNSMYVSDS
jgi:hypothetical protein